MSIFSSIAKAEHTVTAWIEKEFVIIYGKAPELASIADAVLKYAGPALQLIVTMEAGSAAGAVVGAVLAEAQRDLTVASALVYDFGPNPHAATIISGVKDNLGGLLTAGHISNAAAVSNVNKVVNGLDVLATAMAAKP